MTTSDGKQNFMLFSAALTTHQLIRADFMIQIFFFHSHSLKCFIVVSLARIRSALVFVRAHSELLNILKQTFKLLKFIFFCRIELALIDEWNGMRMTCNSVAQSTLLLTIESRCSTGITLITEAILIYETEREKMQDFKS